MERQKSNAMKYAFRNLKNKYEHLMKGNDYHECFTDLDGLYFYQVFTESGLIQVTDNEKIQVWKQITGDVKSWWTKSDRNPRKAELIAKSKSTIFRNWIQNKADSKMKLFDIWNLI
jgi:hypothetical protein